MSLPCSDQQCRHSHALSVHALTRQSSMAPARASFRSAPKACFLALPWAPHLHLREVCLPPGHLGGIWFPPETLAQPPFTLAAGSSTQNRAWNIVVLSKYF